MNEQALLIISFGTSHEETRRRTIGAVEQHLAGEFPEYPVAVAYTSPTIRRILAARGQQIPSPQEAMAQLAAQGVRRLLVQPTHLICGEEFHSLGQIIAQQAHLFEQVQVGVPLLYDPADYAAVAQCLAARLPTERDEALVLLGHGTAHPMNAAYPAMGEMFASLGHSHVFVGTVEGWPTCEQVLERVRRAGYQRVALAPLMLVAGDHARNDMAGEDEDSWKSIFEAAGFAVRCLLQGLGEFPEIQQLYAQHAKQALAR